jgi:organic hydroperoxide reductase OsmC/OhrA
MCADIRHRSGKTDKQFLFEAQLDWLNGYKGVLTAEGTGPGIYVALPPAFGGAAGEWSPEHLLLCSISSSFMTTYLAYAQKLGFAITHFSCNAIGQIEIVDGKYQFTNINLYPQIFIADDSLRKKANQAIEKTHKYCLVGNSLSAAVFYHSQVILDAHPKRNSMG